MSVDPNGFLPPTPRAQTGPTTSELVPFRSTKINIWKSKALLPLMMIALAVVALFGTMTQPLYFIDVVAWLAVVSIFLGIYYYSGMRKQWWWYLAPGLVAWVLLAFFFPLYTLVFREILPGDLSTVEKSPSFLSNFYVYFFAAGLCEESLKATPVLLAFALTLRRGLAPAGPIPSLRTGGFGAVVDALTLRSPLDGMLMGFAAGAAFILDETLGQYVPSTIHRVFNSSQDEGLAMLFGLELVIPRVLQGVSGHMGWAAIFGYFIGLAARYPKRAVTLIPIGYLVAATLHTLWDTVSAPLGNAGLVAVSVLTVLIFVACLLKAKQLHMAWSGLGAGSDSILVGAPQAGPYRAAPGPAAAGPGGSRAPVGGVLSGLQSVASGLESLAGAAVDPTRAPPVPASPPAAEERYAIGTATSRFGIEPGRMIDFGALFGSQGAPAGAIGEIARHPSDPRILGLKNTGTTAWTSSTPAGAAVTVPPGRSLRIADGTRIHFGALVIDIQAY